MICAADDLAAPTFLKREKPLEFHQLASIFPLVEGKEFAELVDDVKANGLRHAVLLHEGQILDGRNRYRACQEAGVDCRFEIYDGTDALGHVISLNLRRRHLNESQRAIVAKKLANLPAHRPADNCANLRTSQEDAAKLLQVSRRSVQHAAVVLEKAAPEMVQAVERGEIPVSAAAQVIHLPKARQRELAAEGKKATAKAAKQSRIRSQPKATLSTAPKETEHDRDLRFLREAWAATCESAHEAFLLELEGKSV